MIQARKYARIKRTLSPLVLVGVISGLLWGTQLQSGNRWMTTGELISYAPGLWLVQRRLPKSGNCAAETKIRPENPCVVDECWSDNFMPWDEWKACKSNKLEEEGFVGDEQEANVAIQGILQASSPEISVSDIDAFDAFILQYRDQLPWSLGSNFTAVLLEFRPLEKRLAFSIQNTMNNLPVHWRLQVVGGSRICNTTNRMFPIEVAAGKIVLTDIGERRMHQSQVSAILTSKDFYSKLLGDTWLFFQYDSAICGKQRHLIKNFIETKRGWWGAPWSHWTREPRVGGNGGFSLRAKDFIFNILDRFPWSKDGRPEDWYFCNVAADIYEGLPERLRPATFDEEMSFSSEMLYSEAPLGVHQYWSNLSPESPRLRTMFENCPEMLNILPAEILAQKPMWREMVCSLNITNMRKDATKRCEPM